MKEFLVAVQFLTWTPLKLKNEITERQFGHSMLYFPLVGLLLGLLLIGAHIVCSKVFPPLVVSGIILTVLILMTGALHLDGFADTLDGFYAGKTREEILEIMKDPHIGAVGVVGLVCLLLLKFVLIHSLTEETRNAGLLLMPVLSRWAMVIAAVKGPYARHRGLGKPFMDNLSTKEWLGSTILALVISIALMRTRAIFLCLFVAGVTFALVFLVRKKIGGVTGDTLGAIGEIVEILVLVEITASSTIGPALVHGIL